MHLISILIAYGLNELIIVIRKLMLIVIRCNFKTKHTLPLCDPIWCLLKILEGKSLPLTSVR